MQVMKVDELIPHKMNSYFFDDIEGEPWMAFLDSIRTSGVIEPIIATQDKVIVSGHQRVRACKKLGIKEVAVEIRRYESEDEVLKQLIETNIRQRGIGNTNVQKLGRCLKELDRIYEIAHGGDRKSKVQNAPLKTQKDLADEIGISLDAYKRYESLTNLIPEIADMVNDGINMTSAVAIARKLSPEEQKQLAEQIGGQEKVSGSEVQKYIDEIKAAKEENTKLRMALSEQGARNAELQHKLNNREVEVREVEVVPDDYEKTKKDFESFKSDYQRMVKEKQDAVDKMIEAEQKLRSMESGMAEAKGQLRLEEDSEFFAIRTYDFIKNNGGYIWIFDKINELPEEKRQNFVKAIYALDAYTKQLIENIGGYGIE